MWVVHLLDIGTTCSAVCQVYYSISIDSKIGNQEYALVEDYSNRSLSQECNPEIKNHYIHILHDNSTLQNG